MGTPHRVRTRRFRVAVAGRHAPARGRSWVGAEIRHAQRPARRSAGPAQARPAGPGLPVVRRPDTCPRRRSAVSAQSWTGRGTSACGRRTAAGPQRSSRARARCRRCPGPAVLRTPTTWFTASNGPSPSTAAASVPLSRRLPNPSRSPPRRRSRPVHPGRPGTGSPTAPGPGMPLSTHCWRPGTAAARSSVSSA